MNLDELFPSQLFLNREKIEFFNKHINPFVLDKIPPISILKFGDKTVFLDGHTRAFLAYDHGLTQVPVYWEPEEYDWELYEICIQWCLENHIHHISDLKTRILERGSFEKMWIGKCQAQEKELEKIRNQNPPK